MPTTILIIILFIINNESAVQGKEPVRRLNRSEDPYPPHNQPMEGRKRENSGRQKRKSRLGQWESIVSTRKSNQSNTIEHRVIISFLRDTDRRTKVLRYWDVLQRKGVNENRLTRVLKHHKYHVPAHTVKACTALRLHWVALDLK